MFKPKGANHNLKLEFVKSPLNKSFALLNYRLEQAKIYIHDFKGALHELIELSNIEALRSIQEHKPKAKLYSCLISDILTEIESLRLKATMSKGKLEVKAYFV